MNNTGHITELLEQHSTIDELSALLENKNLSEVERRMVEDHTAIIASLASLPTENIPESLRQQLYVIEQQPVKSIVLEILNDSKRLLPSVLALGGLIVLFNSGLLEVQTAVRNIIVASLGSGFVFYQMLKSKFFIV